MSIGWAKPSDNDLKHVLHSTKGSRGPMARILERGKQLWPAAGVQSIAVDDGHTRSRERNLTRILLFHYSRYQKREHGKHTFFRERTSAMSKKECPARLAPRWKLTCQPRHTNKGEGGFSMGGMLATATEKPDRSGKASSLDLSYLSSHSEELTPHAKNAGGGQAREFRRCRFWGALEGRGETMRNERHGDPATA